MLITGKKEVSKFWMFLAILPWCSQYLEGMAMGAAFFFSLYKFIDNPAGLTFILSLPPIIGLVMGPLTHFLSDRIWTRWGRRKPFIVASWFGTLTTMVFMPLMPTFWSLLLTYMVFIFFNTMGGPAETLEQEVIPPHQRVTASALQTWIRQLVMLLFYLFALGRFDDVGYLAGMPVTGEQAIYWSASLSTLVMIMIIMLGIKETNPHSSLAGKRLGLKAFFTSILDRNLRQVYILIFGAAVYNVGTGAIGSLLYVQQWQFTKQELGTNVAVGGALNLIIILVLGLFANKLPRMKTYQWLLVIGMIVNISFYFYVHNFIYDQRPTLIEVIVFGEMLAVIGTLKGMIYAPMVYDYVPRNEMGTYAAGASIINRLVNILMLNGAGLFVVGYSSLFLPQGGERVRVTFPDVMQKEAMVSVLQQTNWQVPDGDKGTFYDDEDIHALPWYGDGAVLEHGRGYELMFHNPDSVDLFEKRKKLKKKEKPLTAKATNARALAKRAEREGRKEQAEKLRADADDYEAEAAPLLEEIDALQEDLDQRSEALREQILTVLGNRLLQNGDQILGVDLQPAMRMNLDLPTPPSPRGIQKSLDTMRDSFPEIIDLRARKEGLGYELELTAALEPSAEASLRMRNMEKELRNRLDLHAQPGEIPPAELYPDEQALTLHLRVLEDPLDQHPSPIMRVVHFVIDVFAEPPKPERRVYSFARNLRSPDIARHVRVLPGEDHSIRLTVLLGDLSEDADVEVAPEIRRRLEEKLDNPDTVDLAAAMYLRTVDIGDGNRLTVARPLLETGFSERKYDYMSSYFWMLILDAIGIIITVVFVSREKRGLIHKRGIEEMEVST